MNRARDALNRYHTLNNRFNVKIFDLTKYMHKQSVLIFHLFQNKSYSQDSMYMIVRCVLCAIETILQAQL